MAGQGRRGTRGHGRSFRADSLRSVALATAGASDPAVSSSSAPAARKRRPGTRATYRNLLLRGLAPEEAANLTAFLCGIHVETQPWKLDEVNRLLFLRELQDAGRFGFHDGAAEAA
jgi:hypothetical protein